MIALCGLLLMAAAAFAQNGLQYTEASDLTLVGKLMPDTPNPYHRVDTVRFKGFTRGENAQVRMSSGISVAFRTDSKRIAVKTVYGSRAFPANSGSYSARGYDLYIKKNGQWTWAGVGVASQENPEQAVTLVQRMDGSMHECLLYLPLFSEEYSVQVGTDEGAVIEPLENPFRYRIALFGSSFTHGSSSARPGMTYPAQLTRMTGLQFLSLGCSGNSRLQSYFADVLAAADADAFVFDAFSNPSLAEIRARLFPFIEKIQAAHPGKPLIFQKTIYRESRNFDTASEKNEQARIELVDSLMHVAVKKYKDVYFIDATNATDPYHDSSIDGVHPSNHGYTLWAESVRKPLRRILRKYGIK
ncbi:MAG: SGNH/GDSL hydrolase family protein [Bacteroidales bacterium]|nr:SGNH/GDSL hydrolase family protein [Bacteroidales bacterium]